ncbi:MAG: AAA family ATPase, partial [bacterium]|nr:AAA family ATPase [bacterium]
MLVCRFKSVGGFSRQETETLVTYYRDQGLIAHSVADLMAIFDHWYGNYLFSEDAQNRLYNSDMILYFLREYMRKSGIPANMIDRNVRIDYGKLRHLIIMDEQEEKRPTVNGNFSKLKQIMADGETSTQLVSGFSLDKLTHPENFKSLLYYLGLLT